MIVFVRSLDLQKCELPDSLEELADSYTIQYIGKLTSQKQFHDVQTKADICHSVLRNVLHVSCDYCLILSPSGFGRKKSRSHSKL